MALKALDKTYGSFEVGDIVVHGAYTEPYGVRIVQKVFLDTTGEYHFIGTCGEVKKGKWVDNKSDGQVVLMINTTKDLRSYSHKWTPGETFTPGDILKDQDGALYLYASEENVWNLDRGTRASQAKWEAPGTSYGGRVFTRRNIASGLPFSSVIELKDKWDNRF